MLASSSSYVRESFLKRQRVVIDSCVIIDWCNKSDLPLYLSKLEEQYWLVFCAVSMIEVGIGPKEKVPAAQIDFAKSFMQFTQVNWKDMYQYDILEVPMPRRIVYSPSSMEYLATRYYLSRLLETTTNSTKTILKLINDSLIYI